MGCATRATTARESQISGPNASFDWGPHRDPGDGATPIAEARRQTQHATYALHARRSYWHNDLAFTRGRRTPSIRSTRCASPATIGCNAMLEVYYLYVAFTAVHVVFVTAEVQQLGLLTHNTGVAAQSTAPSHVVTWGHPKNHVGEALTASGLPS